MKNIEKIIKKVEEMKKGGKIDLSMEEDLSIAVMNLISIEEHLFYTAEKTGKDKYFDLLNSARKMRTELMRKLLVKTEGETWCISKHLLATTMRLIEVATKLYSNGEHQEAKEMFDRAFEAYSMFWAIRLDVIDSDDIKDSVKESNNSANLGENDSKGQKLSFKDIVKKLVDCCKE